MSATMIALSTVNANEPEALKAYSEAAGPLIKAAGGVPVARYKFSEAVVGASFPQIVFAVEFPTVESIRNLFESDAYKHLVPLREKAFSAFSVCIAKAG